MSDDSVGLMDLDDLKMMLEWQNLRNFLHQAVRQLDQAIAGTLGQEAVKHDRYARFNAVHQGLEIGVYGRLGQQTYAIREDQAYPVDIVPNGILIAAAVYEGRYVRQVTGEKEAYWDLAISEDWLVRTKYLTIQYQIQKYRRYV